jgi:excinuclease UvrABC ATPase subunit
MRNIDVICEKCSGKGYIKVEDNFTYELEEICVDCEECFGLGVIEEEVQKSKFKKDSTKY